MAVPVRFYFDYISPNAYLAWARLRQLQRAGTLTIDPVPVLFAGLLKPTGQLGPAEIAPKARWMTRNNLRKAALLGLPLARPAHHPFNPLIALRMTVAHMRRNDDPDKRPDDSTFALVDTLFDAIWARGVHGADGALLADALSAVGLPGPALRAAAGEASVKAALRSATEDAVVGGVFGVPTVIVGGELFWGYDDLWLAELRIAGEDPLDVELAARWERETTPSAMRPEAGGGPGADTGRGG